MLGTLRQFAQHMKRETHAVYLAARDPRTPWYARALALLIVAYAVSPIDLIPDFIPILGYLDDLILVPLGILLVLRLVPAAAMADARAAARTAEDQPQGRIAAIVVVVLWLAASAWLAWVFWPEGW